MINTKFLTAAATAAVLAFAPLAAQASSGQLNAHPEQVQQIAQVAPGQPVQEATSQSKGRFQENAPDYGNFRFGVEQTAGNAAVATDNNG